MYYIDWSEKEKLLFLKQGQLIRFTFYCCCCRRFCYRIDSIYADKKKSFAVIYLQLQNLRLQLSVVLYFISQFKNGGKPNERNAKKL